MPFCITVTGFPANIEASHGNRNYKLETRNWKLANRRTLCPLCTPDRWSTVRDGWRIFALKATICMKKQGLTRDSGDLSEIICC